jgi:hypothetical protein
LANFSCVTPLELKQSLAHSSPSLVHRLCEIGSDPKCICIELEHLVVLVIVFAAWFLVFSCFGHFGGCRHLDGLEQRRIVEWLW